MSQKGHSMGTEATVTHAFQISRSTVIPNALLVLHQPRVKGLVIQVKSERTVKVGK